MDNMQATILENGSKEWKVIVIRYRPPKTIVSQRSTELGSFHSSNVPLQEEPGRISIASPDVLDKDNGYLITLNGIEYGFVIDNTKKVPDTEEEKGHFWAIGNLFTY